MYCTWVDLECDNFHSGFGALIHHQMLTSSNICGKGDTQVPAENKAPYEVLTKFIDNAFLTDC